MKKYIIHYTFDGKGYAEVMAENEKEAENMFKDGDAEYFDTDQDNFDIQHIDAV